MKILGRIYSILGHALVRRFDLKAVGMSLHGWCRCDWVRSCVLAGVLGLLLVSGASAAYKLARGQTSPFTGNAHSDLATVRVHILVQMLHADVSMYDGGSIVVPNVPPKGKGERPCGEQATYCVCAPGMWVFKSRLSKKGELREGNEVFSSLILMGKEVVQWQRLPGPMVVRFYVHGFPLSGMPSGVANSDVVMTKAGSLYDLSVLVVQEQGGWRTIKVYAHQDIATAESVEALRNLDGVRALQPLEDSQNIARLPNGVYGFADPSVINTNPSGVVGGTGPDKISLARSPSGTQVMEIHKLASGEICVVGYVSKSDLARLEAILVNSTEVTIFFTPNGEGSPPVAIPLSAIRVAKESSMQSHYARDLSVDLYKYK